MRIISSKRYNACFSRVNIQFKAFIPHYSRPRAMSLQRNLTCGPCGNRRFVSRDILLHHVKTSSQWHPTCATCERRFTSSVAYEAVGPSSFELFAGLTGILLIAHVLEAPASFQMLQVLQGFCGELPATRSLPGQRSSPQLPTLREGFL